jgi:hypothetical protein
MLSPENAKSRTGDLRVRETKKRRGREDSSYFDSRLRFSIPSLDVMFMDKLKASEIPKDFSTQLHTVWEVDEEANKKEEENITQKINNLTVTPPDYVSGWTHAHAFSIVQPDIVDILCNQNFENPLVAPLFEEGEHVVELNFSWVFGERSDGKELIPIEPRVLSTEFEFDPQTRIFALVFPASPEVGLKHPRAHIDTVAGKLEPVYFQYALAYVCPVLDVIKAVAPDAVLGCNKGVEETAADVLKKMAVPDAAGNVFYTGAPQEFVDPRVGMHFPSLMKFVDYIFGIKSSNSVWQKYAERGLNLKCEAGGTTFPASLMRKHYPVGRPGPPTEDSLESFKIEIKMHLPIIGMSSGKVNREIWGDFGKRLLSVPATIEDLKIAWEAWAARGPEISIAYGLGGTAQTKMCWLEGKLFLVPAFPVSFAANYNHKLQRLYKGGHVSKRQKVSK